MSLSEERIPNNNNNILYYVTKTDVDFIFEKGRNRWYCNNNSYYYYYYNTACDGEKGK